MQALCLIATILNNRSPSEPEWRLIGPAGACAGLLVLVKCPSSGSYYDDINMIGL